MEVDVGMVRLMSVHSRGLVWPQTACLRFIRTRTPTCREAMNIISVKLKHHRFCWRPNIRSRGFALLRQLLGGWQTDRRVPTAPSAVAEKNVSFQAELLCSILFVCSVG